MVSPIARCNMPGPILPISPVAGVLVPLPVFNGDYGLPIGGTMTTCAAMP